MKVEDQICTLQQAMSLAALGVIQESIFYHYQDKTPTNPNMSYYGYPQGNMPWNLSLTGKPSRLSTSQVCIEYSAFTVAELGLMLPYGVYLKKDWYFFKQDEIAIRYTNNSKDHYLHIGHGYGWAARTEAQCRAEVMIFLLTNLTNLNGVSIKEINKKLIT